MEVPVIKTMKTQSQNLLMYMSKANVPTAINEQALVSL